MSIELDENLSKKLNSGMAGEGGVELPFPVMYLWALNGQANLKGQIDKAPATYYGGFACKAEDLHDLVDQGMSVPGGWKASTSAGRDGSEFDVYSTREVVIAPYAKRISWLVGKERHPQYVEGGRRHVQVVAYLAEVQGENGARRFIPWGDVVLTAKGYQAGNLLDAFSKWDKATKALRAKVAPKVPAWCFYMKLGTFGKERVQVNVGKPGAQSPITPVTCFIPDKLDEAMFSRLFVGQEIASVMAEHLDEAQEWLQAWKEAAVEKGGADGYSDGYDDGYYQPPENDPIPF